MSDSTLDFTDVLAESIEAIERGEMTIQECLEKYPAYAGRLGELLPLMVMLHGAPQVEPGAVFKQQSPERLLAQLPPAAHENVTFLGALRHKWQSSGFAIPILIRRPGMAWTIILTVFATVMAGTGVLYAADTAVPGDPLYAVDRSLETLQLNLANDPESEFTLRMAHAEERLVEAQELEILGDEDNLQNALEGYGESILAAGQSVQSMGEEEQEALLLMFDDALPRHDALIADLLDDDPESGDDEDDPDDSDSSKEDDGPNDDDGDPDDEDDPDDSDKPDDDDDDERDDDSDRCLNDQEHPQAQAIAEAEGVPAEQIMEWFCSGFGFGEIKLAFRIREQTGLDVSELLEQREDLGWGRIMQEAGLIGNKDGKQTGPPDHAGPPEDKDPAEKEDKSPKDSGPPDHAGPPEDRDPAGKKDKSPEDSGPPDHAGPPEGKKTPKDDKSPEDSGPPDHAGPSDSASPTDDARSKDNNRPPDKNQPPGKDKNANKKDKSKGD